MQHVSITHSMDIHNAFEDIGHSHIMLGHISNRADVAHVTSHGLRRVRIKLFALYVASPRSNENTLIDIVCHVAVCLSFAFSFARLCCAALWTCHRTGCM